MYIHAKIQLKKWSGLVAVYFGKIVPKTCDALYTYRSSDLSLFVASLIGFFKIVANLNGISQVWQ